MVNQMEQTYNILKINLVTLINELEKSNKSETNSWVRHSRRRIIYKLKMLL